MDLGVLSSGELSLIEGGEELGENGLRQRLTLLPEGGVLVYLPPGPYDGSGASKSALVVADTHFGKSATFRACGLPVPEGGTAEDLRRLDAILAKYGPDCLVVAGDFLHSERGRSSAIESLLVSWLDRVPVEVIVTTGNHDWRAGKLQHSRLQYTNDWPCGVLEVAHEPFDWRTKGKSKPACNLEVGESDRGLLRICGHLHPVARLSLGGRSSLRSKVFYWDGFNLVLPAFGSFTGGHAIEAAEGVRVFVPSRERVVEWTGKLAGGR